MLSQLETRHLTFNRDMLERLRQGIEGHACAALHLDYARITWSSVEN